jgi:hypothetical protein
MKLFNAIEFYEELTNTPGIRNWSGDLSGQTLDVQSITQNVHFMM